MIVLWCILAFVGCLTPALGWIFAPDVSRYFKQRAIVRRSEKAIREKRFHQIAADIRENKENHAAAQSKALAKLKEPQPVFETYGHPWAPIPHLKAVLPQAPSGYAWEITASLNEYGNPALRLGMLNMLEHDVTDFIQRDMVVIRRWQYADDDTFVRFYRRAGATNEELCKKIFMAHLINPMADWAKENATRKVITEPPALTTNYMLVEAG